MIVDAKRMFMKQIPDILFVAGIAVGTALCSYTVSVSEESVSEPLKMLFLGFCLLAIAVLLKKLGGKNFD